jgi:alpha-L-arabinofuranosidase
VTLEVTGGTLAGSATLWEVNGPDVSATNSFENPRAVDVHERKVHAAGAQLQMTLPAHSLTVLRVDVARG